MLCSPEKRNGKAGLSVSCTEHRRKNISSPKQSRRKKILPHPDRSPIIEAFSRGVKSAKKDSPDNGTCVMNPKVVVRKLFLSDDSVDGPLLLKDNICTRNLERTEKYLGRTRTPLVENTRECKIEYVDPGISSSGLNKLTFTSKHDSLKKESFVSWCQKTVCSTMLQSSPVSSSVPLSLETLCRERQLKKEKKMQCKQQAFGSVHKTVGTPFSDQDTRDFLRKRSSSTSLESSSGLSANKPIRVRKSLTYPSVCSNSRNSSGISKDRECPEKRKRISSNTDLKNSQKSDVQRLEKHNFSRSLEKHNSECLKDRISPSCDLQLEDCNPSDSDFLPSVGYICVEENKNSLFSKESKSLLSCTQSDGLLEELAMGIQKSLSPLYVSDKRLASSTAHNSISKVGREKTWRDKFVLPSKESSEHPVSVRDGNNFLSSKNNDCEIIPSSLQDLNEPNDEGFNHKTSLVNRRCLSDGEDEISDYNLDSSDDDDAVLVPFEELMARSRPSVRSPEQTNDEDDASQDVLLCVPSVETKVSYMNRLEHLLKEKEEFRRVDELERQLQQVKQETEINFSSEEQSSDGELSSEHRAFIERFSVISDGIPDQHPGENIFQIAHAGTLFSQNNLDLRNAGFYPQNPIEKYLLGSGITQQLFVILEGLLTSAYHCSPCPVPIQKWMFQFLQLCISIYPEGYTDKEISLLLLVLFKLSLEKELKQFPLVDLECLIIKLLENIREWDTKMSLLCKDLVKMKPSNLLKRLMETVEHQNGPKETVLSELEPQAYYLTYVLLHLVREASDTEITAASQRKWLVKLCSTLEKHVKCDIRDDARLFYRTKVKDLVARTYSKWQQMICSSQLTQGTIHDFWDPDN
ncbi:hypothetical protein lerEdw1_007904 [Lerista edwardsae]|nr:hypothetical protein lerEdw1_007904 [Lerista edwardsae]